jgi:NitT/TauT family transport system permease protein
MSHQETSQLDQQDVSLLELATERMKNWFRQNIGALLIVIILLIAWDTYSRYFNPRGNIYFPSIEYTIAQTIEHHDRLLLGIQTTFTEVFAGFAIGVAIGLVAAFLFNEVVSVRQAFLPSLIFGNSIPHAIVAPLFVIWFGANLWAVALYVSWSGFFLVFVNTLTGLSQMEEGHYHFGEILGASKWQMIKHLKIWVAAPNIITGVKVAVQASVVGAIIAEFIATTSGLGHLIVVSQLNAQGGLLFGTLFATMIVSIVVFKTVGWVLEYITPPVSDEAG